jgi:hypothetical protein
VQLWWRGLRALVGGGVALLQTLRLRHSFTTHNSVICSRYI